MNQKKSPSLIARETFQQLVSLKMPPTPDNYQNIYNELSGMPAGCMSLHTKQMLSKLTNVLPCHTPELTSHVNLMKQATNDSNWGKFQANLMDLIKDISAPASSNSSLKSTPIAWETTIPLLLEQLDVNHGSLTTARKRRGLNQVLTTFAGEPVQLHDKLLALINSWAIAGAESNDDKNESEFSSDNTTTQKNNAQVIPDQLQQLLTHILTQIANQSLSDDTFTKDARALSKQIAVINDESELELFITDFKKLGSKLTSHSEQSGQLQQGLLRLFNLLIDRTETMLAGDEWLNAQFALIRKMLSGPLNLLMLSQVEENLKEIIQRQEVISFSLNETKETLKCMMTSLIGNIEEFSSSTDNYHHKIEVYSETIGKAKDISTLSDLMLEIVAETKKMQVHTLNSRDNFLAARAEADVAQNKISQLEVELQQLGEQAQEDHLTGILNRRGLDSAFKREAANAKQQQSSMCLAMIDIDNFKKLNDTHGHKVGDDALVYLVEAMKKTVRPDDIVARFGGEEFVILLPNTQMEEAIIIISRIKRSLTKNFFLNMNKRLLITFSAGVAEYKSEEPQDSVLVRADTALYKAKNNGKNQVIAALPI